MNSGFPRRYSNFASGEIPAAIKLVRMFFGSVLSNSIGLMGVTVCSNGKGKRQGRVNSKDVMGMARA